MKKVLLIDPETSVLRSVIYAVKSGFMPFNMVLGIDAHIDLLSLCAILPAVDNKDLVLARKDIPNNAKMVKQFISDVCSALELPEEMCMIRSGYESGALGYSLHRELVKEGVHNMILAVTTMKTEQGGKRIKTDKRDAFAIAQCIAHNGCNFVAVPEPIDESNRDFIRMRESHVDQVKVVKQQIGAFISRRGEHYPKAYWTAGHRKWLRELFNKEENADDRLILDEYLSTLSYLEDKVSRFDQRIVEIARSERYWPGVHRLICLKGIDEIAAVKILVEIFDFTRFPTASAFANFLGLVPGEHSSNKTVRRLGITKTGNARIRTTLIQAAQAMSKSRKGYKSKALLKRQEGIDSKYVEYADRANERLVGIYWTRHVYGDKNANVVKTSMARELACFIWGLMTDHLETRREAMSSIS